MKKLFFILAAIVLINNACSPRVIYVKGDTTVEYRDSIITKIDSIEVPLPVEVIQTIVPAVEVWEAETSLAEARCELDTNLMVLRGHLKNKQKSLPVEIEHKEEFHQRDSIVREPYPVEVEKIVKVTPKWALWSVAFNLFLLILLGTGIYVVLRK